jgi:hypothetical protein
LSFLQFRPCHSVPIFPVEKVLRVKTPTFIVSIAIKFFRFLVPLKILRATRQASRDIFLFFPVSIRGVVVVAVTLLGRKVLTCFRTYVLSDQAVPNEVTANVMVTGDMIIEKLARKKCFQTISVFHSLWWG